MRMISGAKWISSIDVHQGGDNILVGTLDKRVIWYDLDLGKIPYRTYRYHDEGVRQVKYHPKYPLFATCSDDGITYFINITNLYR